MSHRHTCHTPVRDGGTHQHREPERARVCDGLARAVGERIHVPRAAAGPRAVHIEESHATRALAVLGRLRTCAEVSARQNDNCLLNKMKCQSETRSSQTSVILVVTTIDSPKPFSLRV